MLPTSLMILTAVLASTGGWIIVRVLIGDRAKGRLRCPACWYDMQGSPSLVCPECGHDAGDPKRLSLTRRRYRRVVVGLMLIAVAWYAMEVSYRVKFENEPISTAAIPTTWYAAVYPALDHPARLVLIERLKRVRGNKTDVWTWQGWLLAKQAARAIEREATDTTIRGDGFDLLQLAVSRTGCGGDAVLSLLSKPDTTARERGLLFGSALTRWNQTRDFRYVSAVADQLQQEPVDRALSALCTLSVADYRLASDEQLAGLWTQVWATPESLAYPSLDQCLLAIQERPNIARPLLTRLLDWDLEVHGDKASYRSLGPVAVLQAVEGAGPPIRVQCERSPIVWSSASSPDLRVRIRAGDLSKYPITLRLGSGHRDPRNERFRIEIRDERGDVVRSRVQSLGFGGHTPYRRLSSDLDVPLVLPLDRYTRRPPPGKYHLRVQYHDRVQIAALEDVSGLIIFESEPVELIVE